MTIRRVFRERLVVVFVIELGYVLMNEELDLWISLDPVYNNIVFFKSEEVTILGL